VARSMVISLAAISTILERWLIVAFDPDLGGRSPRECPMTPGAPSKPYGPVNVAHDR